MFIYCIINFPFFFETTILSKSTESNEIACFDEQNSSLLTSLFPNFIFLKLIFIVYTDKSYFIFALNKKHFVSITLLQLAFVLYNIFYNINIFYLFLFFVFAHLLYFLYIVFDNLFFFVFALLTGLYIFFYVFVFLHQSFYYIYICRVCF